MRAAFSVAAPTGAAAPASLRPQHATLQCAAWQRGSSTKPRPRHATRAGSGGDTTRRLHRDAVGSSSSSREDDSSGVSPVQFFLFVAAASGPLAFLRQQGPLAAAAAVLLPGLAAAAVLLLAADVARWHAEHMEYMVQLACSADKLTRLEYFAQEKVVCRKEMGLVREDFPLLLAIGGFLIAAKFTLSAAFTVQIPAWVAGACMFALQTLAVRPILVSFRAAWRALHLCQAAAGGPRLIHLARVVRRDKVQRAA